MLTSAQPLVHKPVCHYSLPSPQHRFSLFQSCVWVASISIMRGHQRESLTLNTTPGVRKVISEWVYTLCLTARAQTPHPLPSESSSIRSGWASTFNTPGLSPDISQANFPQWHRNTCKNLFKEPPKWKYRLIAFSVYINNTFLLLKSQVIKKIIMNEVKKIA